MTDWREDVKPLTLKGQISVPYTWSVGEAGSRFLISIRDNKKILGNKCNSCNTVYVPPRKTCGKCFIELDIENLREIKNQGTINEYTIVRYDHPTHPVKAPFAYVNVRLDGADVGFLHIVKENLDSIKKGARVQIAFKEDRTANILDIDSFEIIN